VLVELVVDDQDHTADWLRSGAVLAAVTGTARPPAGFNSRPLGAMPYVAAASPAYVARHFSTGIDAGSLAKAPSLVFNAKDDLQARWVRRLCRRDVELPRHALAPAGAHFIAPAGGDARRTGARCPAGCAALLAARPCRIVSDRRLEPHGCGCRCTGPVAPMTRVHVERKPGHQPSLSPRSSTPHPTPAASPGKARAAAPR